VKVTEPGGTTVRIGRRWLPWRPRFRKPDESLGSLDAADGIVVAILIVLAIIVVIVLGEWILAVLLLPLALADRFLLRRPWTVDVVRGRELVASHESPTWASSRELKQELAAQAARGELPQAAA
jgi:hypothetical protein